MRRATLVPLTLVVATAATGWLYVVNPALPGPRVGEALPLDELSRTASASLLWFVAVWGAAGVLLGSVTRWARVDRAAAAFVLALGVGLWIYLADGVSIAVVRQVPMREALGAAARLEAVYLSGAVVALAAAVIGSSRRRTTHAPLVVATLVAVGGALDLFLTVLPGDNDGLLRSLTPDAVGPLARAAHAPIGLALVLAARGLARRRQRAWRVAVGLAGASAALHVLHGLNDGTLASVVIVVALVAFRRDFDRPGDASTRGLVLARVVTALLVLGFYGTGALWINRMVADQPFSPGFALRETASGAVGLNVAGSPHLADGFGHWFPLSLLLLTLASTAWVVAGWLAPWRYRVRQDAHERAVARDLVCAWGADTLAPFVLRADKSYFFSDDERAFLAYRVVGGVAIVSGDPIGPPGALDPLVARFVAFAHECDWRIAILGASEARLGLYASHGLQALYHGDEAVVETASFSLDGRAIRKVRQSVHRLEHAGYAVDVRRPAEIESSLRAELEEIAAEWRGDQPERGFVMALDALFRLDDGDAIFVIGRDGDGRPAGLLHFAVSHACSALSLSSMPRLRCTPNGFNEWLICAAIEWARGQGYERVSLNFAPFAAILAPEAELSSLQEVERRALLALKGHFQLDNLLAFNRKFFPRWERRFVVYERRLDLPRVGVAALAAEAYLPFGSARR
jgi:lysyl-tRNA synthetase class 2